MHPCKLRRLTCPQDTRETTAQWPHETKATHRHPDGLLCHSWLGRPRGSLAAVLQAISIELQEQVSLPTNSVKMGSGGAGISLDVLTLFNWSVFNGRFSDFYGATEAPGIAEGLGWLNVSGSCQVRLSLGGTPVAEDLLAGSAYDKITSPMVGELEVASAGAAQRYFGADDGDPDAIAATEAAFTPDGWWRSGDLVELGTKGTQQVLRVLGRAADQLELYFNGDSVWISASELAAAYASAPVVHAGQLVVEGKRDDALLVGVLVPSPAWVATTCTVLAASGRLPFPIFSSSMGPASESDMASRYQFACMQRIKGSSHEAVTLRKLLAAEALKELRLHGERVGLPPVQILSAVIIDPVEWTASAGTAGAVHKTVRRAVLQLHRNELELAFETVKKKLAAVAGGASPHRLSLTRMASVPAPDTSTLQLSPATRIPEAHGPTTPHAHDASPVSIDWSTGAARSLSSSHRSLSRSTSQQPELRTWSATAPLAEAPSTPAIMTMPKVLTEPSFCWISPCDAAVEAGSIALVSAFSSCETPVQVYRMALQAAWRTLVEALSRAHQQASGKTAELVAGHATLLSAFGANGSSSPWAGLLADLWCLVRERVVAACRNVGLTNDECCGALTTLSSPVYGNGCLAGMKGTKRIVERCDLVSLVEALCTPGLCGEPLSHASSIQLAVVHLPVADPATLIAPHDVLRRVHSGGSEHAVSTLLEHSEGSVVVAVVTPDSERAQSLLHQKNEECLSMLRIVAAAFGAPAAAWPVALLCAPSEMSCKSTSDTARATPLSRGSTTPTPAGTHLFASNPTVHIVASMSASELSPADEIQRAELEAQSIAAALDFAQAMSDGMLPADLRDTRRIFGWAVPPLPTAADARVVQRALDAARAASWDYWTNVARDGNESNRLAARELIRDDLNASFDAAEKVVVEEALAVANALATAALSPAENEDQVVSASARLHALVHTGLPAALQRVGENLEIQSKLEQASLASIPSIGAAAARFNTAVVHLRAVAVCAGVSLPWQVRTLDFMPPADTQGKQDNADSVGSLVFSAIPPVECCVTGRQLWHAGLASDDHFPLAAVNMEVGVGNNPTAMTLSIYQALAKIAHALRRVRLSLTGGPDSSLSQAVAALGVSLHKLNPTIAEGGMFAIEKDFHWRAAFPFGWESSTFTTLTPTPAAWVDAALRIWGPRPCLGMPLERAHTSLLAVLPDHSVFDLPPLLETPLAGVAASANGDKLLGESTERVQVEASATPDTTTSGLQFTVSHGFAWLTYAQLSPIVRTLACTLRGLPGLARGDVVALCAHNSPEWLVTDWAVSLAGMCPVGLHVTYTPSELSDAASRVQPAVIVTAADKVPVWIDMVNGGLLPSLRALVVLQQAVDFSCASRPHILAALSPADAAADVAAGALVVESFQTLICPNNPYAQTVGALAWAAEDLTTLTPGRPDNLFTLLFTSGSSGKPKGVIISAQTWRRDIGDYPPACRSFAWPFVNPSFIPLSHSSDRVRCWDTLGRGGRVGFCFYGAENWIDHQTGKKEAALRENTLTQSSNHVETLVLHLAALRPTSLALPPRIWNGLRWLWDYSNQASFVSEGRSTDVAHAGTLATHGEQPQHLFGEQSPRPAAGRRLTRAISVASSSAVPGISMSLTAFTGSTHRALSLLQHRATAQNARGARESDIDSHIERITFAMAASLFCKALSLDDVFGKRVLVIATGGAAPNAQVMQWAQLQFPERAYQESYGATECGAITESGLPMPACSGRALEIRLEPVSGFPFPQYGEMTVKTPTMAEGYWHDEAATRAAFTPDGFWRTGDLVEARPGCRYAVIDRIGALALVAEQPSITTSGESKAGVVRLNLNDKPHRPATESAKASYLVSPAQVDAALIAAAHAAPLPPGLAVEHVCCVGTQQALAVAVCLGHTDAPSGATRTAGVDDETTIVVTSGPLNPPVSDARLTVGKALLEWVQVVSAAAHLQAWETPYALVILPRSLWVSAPGGLLNIQHKVARAQVRLRVEESLA
jgi:long-subunit acyl-CoA synthetase (AMP-forming)